MILFCCLFVILLSRLIKGPLVKQKPLYGRRKKKSKPERSPFNNRFGKKPEWVKQEVLTLKVRMPGAGCRKIADTFNRLYSQSKGVSVGKTWVADLIRDHQYEIQVLSRKLKNRKPKPVPPDLYWGIDLTCKTDRFGRSYFVFGIIEFYSRACLYLKPVDDKRSITILKALIGVVRFAGLPKIIRSDNESVFTSRTFSVALRLLGVKRQRIEKHCPWQNGRIERLFGTLKERLNHWEVDSREGLGKSLDQFRFWYNHVRPHQNLAGKTPSEMWSRKTVFEQKAKERYWFEAWDGLLTGYWLPV